MVVPISWPYALQRPAIALQLQSTPLRRTAELKTLAVIERTMSLLRTILLASLLGFCASGCRDMTPLVTEDTDRTGWVQVAKVPAVSVVKMQRVMIRAGIPAW